MSEDNKSIEEIIAISYFDTDNMNIKNHVDRYFEIKRDIINVLNKYNVMWVLTDTSGFNNKDKEIERLNNIIKKVRKYIEEYEFELYFKYGKKFFKSEILNDISEILDKESK